MLLTILWPPSSTLPDAGSPGAATLGDGVFAIACTGAFTRLLQKIEGGTDAQRSTHFVPGAQVTRNDG